MRQILFSCVGTSDPVRGEHDGPMLHILRHYRPACVYLFLTPEIAALAGQDRRFEKTFAWVTAHWDSYQCAYHPIICKVTRAHDMDALDAPLHEAVAQISRAHPDAEILLNLTSGTPQMQMILAQLATDMRYRTKGIQVSNFEKKSGSTERTNTNGYDVELELECNEDEQSDAVLADEVGDFAAAEGDGLGVVDAHNERAFGVRADEPRENGIGVTVLGVLVDDVIAQMLFDAVFGEYETV